MPIPLTIPGVDSLATKGLTAFPLTIVETSGEGRGITLAGRSLPFRGVPFGSEQRVNIKYFVGNPIAQAQVLGATWLPTEITGRWCDNHLGDLANAPILYNFPPVGSAGKPETPWKFTDSAGRSFQSGGAVPFARAQRARTVRDAIFMLQRSGQLLRVEWGSTARFGFIRSFIPTHDREEDIDWSIEFDWIGDTSTYPEIRVKPKIDPLGLLGKMQKALQEFLNEALKALAEIYGHVAVITQKIKQVGNLISSIINMFTSFAKLALLPLEILGTVKQQLISIKLAIMDLVGFIRSVPAAYLAIKNGGNQTQADAAVEASAAIVFNALKLGVDLMDVVDDLNKLDEGELIAIVNMPEGSTLVDIASQQYGDPSKWRTIATYNNFGSRVVPAGTRVLVPRL